MCLDDTVPCVTGMTFQKVRHLREVVQCAYTIPILVLQTQGSVTSGEWSSVPRQYRFLCYRHEGLSLQGSGPVCLDNTVPYAIDTRVCHFRGVVHVPRI